MELGARNHAVNDGVRRGQVHEQLRLVLLSGD